MTSSIEQLRRAAEDGSGDAQYNYAATHYNDSEVVLDLGEAARWFRRAAENGHLRGACMLAELLRRGNDLPKDTVEAARWYRLAAEQGDTSAALNLGLMCMFGERVEKDVDEATRWFRGAAELGDKAAQNNLAIMHTTGTSSRRDIQWWGRYPCALLRSLDPSVSQRVGPVETCQVTDVNLDIYTPQARAVRKMTLRPRDGFGVRLGKGTPKRLSR
ncbi:hypothetical protein T492DRAFT_193709 [Pavlovales sp. CCMP2436]|nr:hypothetical protein T492DRAFT_193709 [Pavlovales sp. CCMP2436]